MSKQSKQIKRSAKSGRVVGKKVNSKFIGVAVDGTPIYEPEISPETFSKAKLRKVVREVKTHRSNGRIISAP